MARKKKHPEHVNLERYLISYADFITLLFATFVVLYALSQVDISDFQKLEDSLKQAFDAPSIMQGSEGLMKESSDSLFEASKADSMITPLMMEYMSQKYEEESMRELEKTINENVKEGELEGIEAIKTDKGLLIRFNDSYLFKAGSANINPSAKTKLDKVGAMIATKFVLHNIRVEGHTDNNPMSGDYPSNWELSSARACTIIRYFINRFHFMPVLFTAIGFAETRPLVDNSTPAGQAKNRRVELLILKNKYKSMESSVNEIVKMSKAEQEELQKKRLASINSVISISEAAQKLSNGNKDAEENAIILNKVYDRELKRISTETKAVDTKTREKMTGQGDWLKPPASKSVHVFIH